MRENVSFKRVISLIVVVCFLTTNAMAMPVETPAYGVRSTAPEMLFNVPAGLGNIVETYTAPRTVEGVHSPEQKKRRTSDTFRRTVIYIQDAHDSLEAQENIAAMVRHFVKEYGVKTVYEEGYEGPVPTDNLFEKITDPVLKEKISYYLMDKLRVGGAEYAHINRTEHGVRLTPYADFELIGADSINLHLENIRAYEQAAKNRGGVTQDIGRIRKDLQKLIDRNFPKEMKSWLKLKERYQNGQLPLGEYLQRVYGVRSTANKKAVSRDAVRLPPYPSVEGLLSGDPKAIKKIDLVTLLEEIKALENEIVEQGLPEERDRKTYGYYQSVLLLEKLNTIELSHEEFTALKESLEGLKTEDVAQFIAHETNHSTVFFRSWESLITDAISFYELAKKRDASISKIFDEFLRSEIGEWETGNDSSTVSRSPSSAPAVLVFGGFHKEAIKRMMKEKGISYVILSPAMGAPSKRHEDYYRFLMEGGKYAFEEAVRSTAEGVRRTEKTDLEMPYPVPRTQDVAKESTRVRPAVAIEGYDRILGNLAEDAAPLRSEIRQDFILKMDHALMGAEIRSETRIEIQTPFGKSSEIHVDGFNMNRQQAFQALNDLIEQSFDSRKRLWVAVEMKDQQIRWQRVEEKRRSYHQVIRSLGVFQEYRNLSQSFSILSISSGDRQDTMILAVPAERLGDYKPDLFRLKSPTLLPAAETPRDKETVKPDQAANPKSGPVASALEMETLFAKIRKEAHVPRPEDLLLGVDQEEHRAVAVDAKTWRLILFKISPEGDLQRVKDIMGIPELERFSAIHFFSRGVIMGQDKAGKPWSFSIPRSEVREQLTDPGMDQHAFFYLNNNSQFDAIPYTLEAPLWEWKVGDVFVAEEGGQTETYVLLDETDFGVVTFSAFSDFGVRQRRDIRDWRMDFGRDLDRGAKITVRRYYDAGRLSKVLQLANEGKLNPETFGSFYGKMISGGLLVTGIPVVGLYALEIFKPWILGAALGFLSLDLVISPILFRLKFISFIFELNQALPFREPPAGTKLSNFEALRMGSPVPAATENPPGSNYSVRSEARNPEFPGEPDWKNADLFQRAASAAQYFLQIKKWTSDHGLLKKEICISNGELFKTRAAMGVFSSHLSVNNEMVVFGLLEMVSLGIAIEPKDLKGMAVALRAIRQEFLNNDEMLRSVFVEDFKLYKSILHQHKGTETDPVPYASQMVHLLNAAFNSDQAALGNDFKKFKQGILKLLDVWPQVDRAIQGYLDAETTRLQGDASLRSEVRSQDKGEDLSEKQKIAIVKDFFEAVERKLNELILRVAEAPQEVAAEAQFHKNNLFRIVQEKYRLGNQPEIVAKYKELVTLCEKLTGATGEKQSSELRLEVPEVAVVVSDPMLGKVANVKAMGLEGQQLRQVASFLSRMEEEFFNPGNRGMRAGSRSSDQWERTLTKFPTWILVDPQGEIAGVIYGSLSVDRESAELLRVLTRQDSVRGRGSLLMDVFLSQMFQEGAQEVFWRSFNAKSHDFYDSYLEKKEAAGAVKIENHFRDDYRISLLKDILAKERAKASVAKKTWTFQEVMESLPSSAQELLEKIRVKDPETLEHMKRVMHLSLITAEELGMSSSLPLAQAALLHDVGKLAIPDEILNNSNPELSEGEWIIMKTHAQKGADLLALIPGLEVVREIVLSHHERADGKGYPRGLKGEEISLEARIIAVADSFDAMTAGRVYQEGIAAYRAVREFLNYGNEGRLDLTAVKAFARACHLENKKLRELEESFHPETRSEVRASDFDNEGSISRMRQLLEKTFPEAKVRSEVRLPAGREKEPFGTRVPLKKSEIPGEVTAISFEGKPYALSAIRTMLQSRDQFNFGILLFGLVPESQQESFVASFPRELQEKVQTYRRAPSTALTQPRDEFLQTEDFTAQVEGIVRIGIGPKLASSTVQFEIEQTTDEKAAFRIFVKGSIHAEHEVSLGKTYLVAREEIPGRPTDAPKLFTAASDFLSAGEHFSFCMFREGPATKIKIVDIDSTNGTVLQANVYPGTVVHPRRQQDLAIYDGKIQTMLEEFSERMHADGPATDPGTKDVHYLEALREATQLYMDSSKFHELEGPRKKLLENYFFSNTGSITGSAERRQAALVGLESLLEDDRIAVWEPVLEVAVKYVRYFVHLIRLLETEKIKLAPSRLQREMVRALSKIAGNAETILEVPKPDREMFSRTIRIDTLPRSEVRSEDGADPAHPEVRTNTAPKMKTVFPLTPEFIERLQPGKTENGPAVTRQLIEKLRQEFDRIGEKIVFLGGDPTRSLREDRSVTFQLGRLSISCFQTKREKSRYIYSISDAEGAVIGHGTFIYGRWSRTLFFRYSIHNDFRGRGYGEESLAAFMASMIHGRLFDGKLIRKFEWEEQRTGVYGVLTSDEPGRFLKKAGFKQPFLSGRHTFSLAVPRSEVREKGTSPEAEAVNPYVRFDNVLNGFMAEDLQFDGLISSTVDRYLMAHIRPKVLILGAGGGEVVREFLENYGDSADLSFINRERIRIPASQYLRHVASAGPISGVVAFLEYFHRNVTIHDVEDGLKMYRRGSFHVVLLTRQTWRYIQKRAELLQEIQRVLAQGGKAFISQLDYTDFRILEGTTVKTLSSGEFLKLLSDQDGDEYELFNRTRTKPALAITKLQDQSPFSFLKVVDSKPFQDFTSPEGKSGKKVAIPVSYQVTYDVDWKNIQKGMRHTSRSEVRMRQSKGVIPSVEDASRAAQLEKDLAVMASFKAWDFSLPIFKRKIRELLAYNGEGAAIVQAFVFYAVGKMAQAMTEEQSRSKILGLLGEISGIYQVIIKKGSPLQWINMGRLQAIREIVSDDSGKEFDAVSSNTVFEFKRVLTLRKLFQQVIGELDSAPYPHMRVLVENPDYRNIRNIVYFGEADDGYVVRAVVAFLKSRPDIRPAVDIEKNKSVSVKFSLAEIKEFLLSEKVLELAEWEHQGIFRGSFGFRRRVLGKWIDQKIEQMEKVADGKFDVIIGVSNAPAKYVSELQNLVNSRSEVRGEKENREREKWTQFLEVYANSLPGFAGVSLNKFWEDVFSKMSAGSRILDLATGNGAVAGLAPGIPGKGFDVWAIDYATPKVIAPGINFRQASMETFSGIKNIPNDFDLVTGQFAIEYGETESVLKQIHKVLKDGGKGVFVIHHKNSFWVERARSLVEQINWAMQTGVFEVAQRYVQSPSGANLKSLQAAFEVLQSEINKRKGSKADHEVLSYILRYGLWVFEEVRAGRVSGLADRIEDAKMQWNNTLWVKEHMINTAFDEGSMDGFRKALKASGFDVLKIEPWQVRGQLRMKEQDMIVAWRVEIQKPVAPIEEAQEVVIPVMVIREETTLADITKYLDEMAGRVFHAGPNATLAPAVQMSWKQRLLTLKQKLELVRDGRLMGHPACLGCVNGGICPLVAGLLRGDKTPKEDANCSKAKRPSLTNEEVTQALQQVKTQLDHPALRSEVRITEDQLFSPQEVRIIDAKRQLLKRIYPFLNQEQKQAILHPHILPVLLGVKSAYVAFEAPENRDPEPSTHVVSEAIGKFPQLWQSLGLIFTNNYIVNLEHLMERFQKEGQILVETGVLTPSQLSRFSKGPVDQAFIRDLKGWLVRYIPSIPGREIVQGFVIGYSLEDIRFQHAYVMNSPEMEFVPGLTLLKDVWPGLPLRDARFVIPAATQGAVHAKPLGYVVDTAYGHLAFSKDLGMSAALTARWESVTHETYRQFAALNDFGQAMPPMALRAFHSLSRSETRILSTRRTFLTGLFAVGAIAITGAPIKALAQWHFEKNIFSKGSWAVKGAEDSGPAENSIQTPGGSFSELKILSQGRQVFSVKGNGFLRAIPLPTRGPDGAMLDWGTSFVMPGYWTGGRYLHNPMITKASFEEGPGGTLVLKGFLLDQAGNWEATDFEIVFHPATEKEARMDVSFTPKVLKDFSIDEDRLQRHEGFQAVQASSMNIGKVHDADLGDYQDAKGIQQKASLQKKNELIFNNPAPLGQKETFYLKNEKLSLWRYRPTVFMRANGSNSFTPQGWVANSSDKNDDNIGAWLHFDNAKSAYLKGETLGVFNFTLGATIPGRSEIRKAEVFRDWAGLQAKARESGVSRLLDPAYILHDWMVLEKVNPEFRPFRLIYGATGVDLSNAFLSTDMKEGFFISDYFGWTANTYGGEVAGDFKKLEDSSFRSQLLATEWAEQYRDEKMKWGYAIGDRLHIPERRLAALAVELNALGIEDIRMTQDGQYPVLTFPWRHPLADETTLRMITFVDADITRPSHYVSTLRGNFDGYYQRAGQEIPLDYERDPGFISELQKFLVDGGLFITDDYAYDPAAEMSRERVFTDQGSRFPLGLPRLSLSHDKELADSILELREKGALRDTPADHYGWDVRIRKSVRSEMRNKDQAPREETTKARPAIPTAFMAKVVDSWAKVNKLNLRSEPSPLDVKSVQVNKAGFVFIGDSTEFERAVAAWAGLIDGTEEGYQWMGKAAESQRSMGYGKKQSFVENARMAANYLSENVDWYAYQRGAIVLDYDDSTGNGYVAVLDRGDQGFPVKKGGGLDIEVVEGGFLAQKSESKGDGIAMGRVIKEGALTIISHGQVAEIKEGEKEARKVISQSYDGARAEEVAAFKGAAVIVRFEASRSEVRKAEPASEEAMTAELEAAKRQFKWWSKKIPAWAEGEKQKIPQILKALHEAGFSLRGGTVQLENGEEGARVVFGVLGTPRTPSSVYNKALQIYKDRGGWDAALREAGLDPVVIKQEPGFIELRNMKNGSERKWPAAGPRSEVRQTELKSRVSEKRTSSTVDAYKDTAEFIQKHIVTEDAAIYTVRDIIARELPSAIYALERITELRHLMDESGKRNTPVILWQNMSLGQFFPYFSETLKTQLGVLELSEDPSKWNAQIADLQPGKTRFILIKQKIASSFPGENRDYADYPEEEWDPSVEMGGAKEAGRIAKALGAPIVMVDHSTKEFSNGQKLWADQSHRDGIVPNWVRAGSVNDLGALRGPLTEERSLVLLNANAQTDGKKSLFDDSDVFSKNGQNRQVVINGEKENFVDAFMKVYATATSKGLRRSETRGPGLEKKLEEIFRKAGVTVRRTEIKEKGILHPTPAEAFDAILQAMDIPADGNITILDAGSGQAQMLIRFAMARPDIKKLIGIEYEPGLVQESEKVLQQAVSEGLVRPGQIVIKQGDFNDETSKKLFEETERVYYFHLGTADAGAMIKTFEANLRPGARVVIYPTQEKPDTYRRVALAETGLFEAQHTSRVSIFTRREGIKKFVVSDELAVETLTMDDVTAVEKILRNGNETEKAALREKLESSLPVKQVDISQTPFKTLGSKLYISSDKSLFNPLDPQKTGFAIANRVAQQMKKGEAVLDVGCGTGVQALMALANGAASAVAIDLKPFALLVTLLNAERGGVLEKISVERVDVTKLAEWKAPHLFDRIISNAPAPIDIYGMDPEDREYFVKRHYDSNKHDLNYVFTHGFFSGAGRLLKEESTINFSSFDDIVDIIEQNGFVIRDQVYPADEIVLYTIGKSSEGPARAEARTVPEKNDPKKTVDPAPSVAALSQTIPQRPRDNSGAEQSVRKKLEALKGKFMIMADMADVAKFTDKQLEEFEVMAHLRSEVRFVFTNDGGDTFSRERSDRLQRLQVELGVNRIVITKTGMEDIALNKGERVIHISKGTRDLSVASRKNVYRGRYLSDEVGIVAVMLLYADQHGKPFEKGMMDLSMASAMLRVAIQEFQNSIVFARAA